MELLWRILYIVLFGGFTWFLHRGTGTYPASLPKIKESRQEILEVLLLWGVAVVIPVIRMFIFTPWLNRLTYNRTLQELINAPLLTIPYLLFPLYVILRLDKRSIREYGVSWKIQSARVTIIAILFGLGSGFVAYGTNQTVIGVTPLPAGVLLLLLYNNDFLEEFYHRGVIQSKLERAVGQTKAIIFGGILFGLTHVIFDITQLMSSQGILFVMIAFVLQTMSGWLLGIVFMKTRSLWPGTACHYLANWLPSILMGIFS
jgi:membrane protease YdiL (CAAX protease family)